MTQLLNLSQGVLRALLPICFVCIPVYTQQVGLADDESPVAEEVEISESADAAEDDIELSDNEIRELEASENPEQLEAEQREQARSEPEIVTKPKSDIELYGSARVRYRGQDEQSDWQDAGTRAGASFNWQFKRDAFLFGRYEAGFNLLTGFENVLSPGETTDEIEDTAFTRLQFIGIDSPGISATYGKNWSPYYAIAEYTDRFIDTGGSASGVYNAQTDGGPTGTGRADRALQSRLSMDFLPGTLFKPFKLDIQLQQGNPIPFGGGEDYGIGISTSAVMTTRKDFTFGLAANLADISSEDIEALAAQGIRDDALALLFGTRAFGDKWYTALTASRLENHETTDEGIYFEGWGGEFFGQYQFRDRFWLMLGYNELKPDSDQIRAGDFHVRYGVVGLRFTLDGFKRMVYANVKLDASTNADGTGASNVYTIGVKWNQSHKWTW